VSLFHPSSSVPFSLWNPFTLPSCVLVLLSLLARLPLERSVVCQGTISPYHHSAHPTALPELISLRPHLFNHSPRPHTTVLPTMAANDYYNIPSTPRPNRKNSNATLPQLPPDPYTAYSPHPTQPSAPYMSSPTFEDSGYRPYADQSQQSLPSPYYASGGGGREHDQSAYSDDIPLRQNPSKGDSDLAMHDHLPDDPAIVDRPPQNAARRRRKQGFFGGKIPWVVYTFTLIQVCVFIAELAKNGEKHAGRHALIHR